MSPEETWLCHWVKEHGSAELMSRVFADLREESTSAPDVELAHSDDSYASWLQRGVPTKPFLPEAPLNFVQLRSEGGLNEVFERVGIFYLLHLASEDRRLMVRLKRMWSEAAWEALSETASRQSPTALELDVMRPMVERLREEPMKMAGIMGMFAIAQAGGRRCWQAATALGDGLRGEQQKTFLAFVARLQTAPKTGSEIEFRKSLGRFLGHG